MKFVKKLRDGEYTIENNQACFSFIFTVFRLFIAGLSVKSEFFPLLNAAAIFMLWGVIGVFGCSGLAVIGQSNLNSNLLPVGYRC